MKHLDRIHELPCVVCENVYGLPQKTPTVAHHLEAVRNGHWVDYTTVALCNDCHTMLHHMSRRGYERMIKLTEIDMLALTIKALFK